MRCTSKTTPGYSLSTLLSLRCWAVPLSGLRIDLLSRLRQKRFGSRLLLKLAMIFALVGVVPGLLIYVVSYQFVSRSIETWFDVKVEGALEAGLNLGRVTLDTLSSDLATKTRTASGQLAAISDAANGEIAERLLDQLGATDIAIWTSAGNLIASVGQSRFQLSPDKPSTNQFRMARREGAIAWIEGLDEALLGATSVVNVKALVPLATSALGLNAETRYLLVTKALPKELDCQRGGGRGRQPRIPRARTCPPRA